MSKQQDYIDVLYKFQCCLANLGLDLDVMESMGEEEKCINKLSNKINLLILILRTLKRQVLLENEDEELLCETDCLTIEQIQNLINKLKTECKECCLDTSFIEECITE
jgi:hypothetical protein